MAKDTIEDAQVDRARRLMPIVNRIVKAIRPLSPKMRASVLRLVNDAIEDEAEAGA